MLDLNEVFKKYDDEYGQFELVKKPSSKRADLTAFIILDRLCPAPYTGADIIGYAAHDEIFLDIDVNKLAEVATEEDIANLVRCGVRYNDGDESLEMFV